MAEIRPFTGYRFKLNKPEDMARHIAPPYDMIEGARIDALYAKDPLNVVRIIQNKKEPTDSANRDRHVRAASVFADWFLKKEIIREDKPAYYIYKQEFSIGNKPYVRTGIIGRLKLVDFSEGVVLPHEKTLAAPKVDRQEHMLALTANTELVFGIVNDTGDLAQAIAQASATALLLGTAVDENGVRHSLLRVDNAETQSQLTLLVAPRSILIADGHHRYETALQYARDHADNPDAQYVMMAMVSQVDPGLIIRPFHRMIMEQPRIDKKEIIARVAILFDTLETIPCDPKTIASYVASPEDGTLIFIDAEKGQLHRLKPSKKGEEMLKLQSAGLSDAWSHLNVSMVNLLFVNTTLGLPLDGVTLHDHVHYQQDIDEVLKVVTPTGPYLGAFFLRHITIETIQAIVAGDERMPQKSTNFFPKMWSGLIFNKLVNS